MLTKKTIDRMLEMPDDRLAAMLKLTLSAAGADTSRFDPDPKTVRKLRALLREVTDADLDRVSVLMYLYRRG